MVKQWSKAWLFFFGSLLGFVPPTFAHETQDNFIEVDATQDDKILATWLIPGQAIQDLWNGQSTGQVPIDELNSHLAVIQETVFDDLVFQVDDEPCPSKVVGAKSLERDAKNYASLDFEVICGSGLRDLTLRWNFLSEETDVHRAIVSFRSPGGAISSIVSNHDREVRFGVISPSQWQQFQKFLSGGVWHIWEGIDHILFLVTLILPSVYCLRRRKWEVQHDFRDVAIEVLKTVSAFTLAHSITLCLVTFGLLSIPTRFVESVIALSVLLAGLNNIFPIVSNGRWKFAFAFGLIHGIGFAEVLVGMKLPLASLINSLVAYNLGVELGQLSIVAVTLPAVFLLRDTLLYRRVVFVGGSAIVSVISVLWMVDRIFDVRFMPF